MGNVLIFSPSSCLQIFFSNPEDKQETHYDLCCPPTTRTSISERTPVPATERQLRLSERDPSICQPPARQNRSALRGFSIRCPSKRAYEYRHMGQYGPVQHRQDGSTTSSARV